MKIITRILCLVLCLLMLLPAIVACGKKDSAYGAQINMYLSSEVYNLDPAYAHLDSGAMKICSLIFEGLMTIDEDGDLKKAMLEDYTYVEDEHIPEDPTDDTFTMTIELKDSAWSDGRAVHADQFLYAWKRLLDPAFDGEGAELLYDIKGAYERKINMGSPDDIKLTADKKVLTIEFTHSIEPEEFLRKTASIALVPLRQDAVEKYFNWASANTTLVTNGPFSVISFYPGYNMQLARSSYYNRDITDDKEVSPTKHVTPYLINIDFQLDGEEMMKAYEDGKLFYISELPANKEIREAYLEKVKLTNSFATHAYYFNTAKAPFDNATVRQVLSKVIDRNALVKEVVYAYAATGIIPSGVNDKTDKDDFAANNDAKISADAMSISDAKAALSRAGIDPRSFGKLYLTVKSDTVSTINKDGDIIISDTKFDTETVDCVVAQKVVAIWKQLGFDFEIKYVNTQQYKESSSAITQYRDIQAEALYGNYNGIEKWVTDKKTELVKTERAQFDVIAVDMQMLVPDAFSALSVFAAAYSGSVLIGPDEQEYPIGHVTGYNNPAYNQLIKEAHDAAKLGDKKTVSTKLHEAEKLLLNDMPIIPLFVYKNATLTSQELSGIKYDYFGAPIFNKTKLKNWQDYIESPEEDDKDDKGKKNKNKD